MTTDYDIAVVGAGPVGLATAIYGRLAGLRVVVFDARGRPEQKACGEGILPRGRAALSEMGVGLAPDDFSLFRGIRFVDDSTVAQADFGGGPGMGVRRIALWRAMAQRTEELGAEISLGTRVGGWRQEPDGVAVETASGTLSARLLVGADGLHSSVRRQAGIHARRGRRRRYGMRRHFACPPWSSFVEVHWSAGAEAYVTPVGPDIVGIAILGRECGRGYDDLLGRFPSLRERLRGSFAVDRVLGAGPFDQRVRRRFGRGAALVGDAAGYVDPLTGEGLTLGFESANALVEVVATGVAMVEYERRYRRLVRTHTVLTRGLLGIAARPALRRRMVRVLSRSPELFELFLAINSGEKPLPHLGVTGALRALGGVVA